MGTYCSECDNPNHNFNHFNTDSKRPNPHYDSVPPRTVVTPAPSGIRSAQDWLSQFINRSPTG